jgi:putative transposase
MKESIFSEQQIAFILKQADDGTSIEEICHKAGVSQQTNYRWREIFARTQSLKLRHDYTLE